MKNFIYGFISCLVLAATLVIPYIWPPELSLIFNSLFWSSLIAFLASLFNLGYLFYYKDTSSRSFRFYTGLLLITLSAVMYMGLEVLAKDIEFWKPHFSMNYNNMFLLLAESILIAKNIVSLGFAAIGASVVANSITEAKKSQISESTILVSRSPSKKKIKAASK